MKNRNKSFFILILVGIVAGSCQNELANVNVNPNTLESPDVTTLTRNVVASEFWNNTAQAWLYGNGMSQLMVYSQSYYNLLYATRFTPINNAAYWTNLYGNARDAATIVAQSKKTKNIGNQAAGLAMEAYAFSQLTELWGDIPYLKALRGSTGTYLAPYDNQQTVYTTPVYGILAKLSTADSLLAASPSVILGDPLYSGNATGWRKFINALRLRTLLRISGKQNVSADMQAIVNSGVIFQSAAESATLKLPNTSPWFFPSYGDRAGDFQVKYMDSILYKFYNDTQDQLRMKLFFDPSTNGSYGGMSVVADATTAQASSSSLFTSKLFSSNTAFSAGVITNSRVITYAEVQFILAEAALKGLISGGAAQAQVYYNNGVLGAYTEYGLNGTAYAAALPLLDPTPANALKQIIMQKWALNLNNGYEGWIEQRRTGIPTFYVGNNSQNGGQVPNKFLYPSDEEFINATNYQNEIQNYPGGKDNANYRAWW